MGVWGSDPFFDVPYMFGRCYDWDAARDNDCDNLPHRASVWVEPGLELGFYKV